MESPVSATYPFQKLSAVITWLRFPLIFLIILLHSYSVVRLNGDHSIFFKSVYPFSLWLGETGVPGFFFISGYLFFHSKKDFLQKLKSRFHTLLVPYLLWNAILIALYLIAYAAGYPQDINHRNISEYGITDYARLFWDRGTYDNGNFVPLLCPFWYIRNLLIMSLLSPIIYYIIKYGREIFLLIVAGWWITTYNNAFIPQTILFFSLGSYFAIQNISPLELFTKNRIIILSLFIFFGFADNFTHTFQSTPINLQIHRLALICNIPALFIVADTCVEKGFTNELLSNSAFIVFAVHYPIVVLLRKFCATKFGDAPDGIHVLLYFICVAVTTAASLLLYIAMERFMPKIKNILSGNR